MKLFTQKITPILALVIVLLFASCSKDNKAPSSLEKGAASPTFTNYTNFNGKKTALSDFKGKFVYIDVWATWCGPCRRQFPYLKQLEHSVQGKNIEIVSISVDAQKDFNKWKRMVSSNQLGGVQLFADKSFNSKFVLDYQINAIPRFILIDTLGKVISKNAPRPSEKAALQQLFDQVGVQ